MPKITDRNPTVQWIWKWISRERRRRNIGAAEFAKSINIRRETLHKCEEGKSGSLSSTMLDALEKLEALGTVAEIDELDWHGAAVSLSKKEREKYDAIAEDSGISRARVVKQLAAEGLIARAEADRVNGRVETEQCPQK